MAAEPEPRDEAIDDDGELIDSLPPLGPLDQSEEVGVEGADDADAWLGSDGVSETVGLDDAEAEEAGMGVEEMFGSQALASEESDWTDSSEPADDLAGRIELPESVEPEYGYTDTDGETDALPLEELDAEYALTPAPPVREDAGAHGVEDEGLVGYFGEEGDDDVQGLPPLLDDTEGDNDLDLGRDVQVDGMLVREEDDAPSLPPAAADVQVVWRGPADDAVLDVLQSPSSLYVLGSALQACRGERSAILHPLTGHTPTSLAFDGERVYVATADGAVLVSPDFSPIPVPVNDVAPLTIAAEAEPSPRLWLWTRDGRLFRSEDQGRGWVRPELEGDVAAFAVDPTGGVGALFVHRGYATLARSVDGGRHWRVADTPDPGHHPRENEQTHLSLFGETIALGHERSGRTYLSTDDGSRFEEIDGLRTAGPLLVAGEPGSLAVYGARSDGGRGVVVRWRPQNRLDLVLDVQAERRSRGVIGRPGLDGSARVHSLRRDPHGSPGAVFVATGFGLFRLAPGGR